jgi:hypothetical protein
MASPGFDRREWKGFRPALSVAAIDVGRYPVLGKQDLAGLHSISDCYVDEGFVAREHFFLCRETRAAGLYVDLRVCEIGPCRK